MVIIIIKYFWFMLFLGLLIPFQTTQIRLKIIIGNGITRNTRRLPQKTNIFLNDRYDLIIINSEMISRIKQFNPKIALVIFVIGLTNRPILSYLKHLLRNLNKTKEKTMVQYVGIQITKTDYFIGVGIPHFDRLGNIIDFSFKREKKGITSQNPENTIAQISNYLGNQTYEFVGVSCFATASGNMNSQLFENSDIKERSKNMWENYPIKNKIKKIVKAKQYGFDNSINANTLAQYKLGNYKITQSLIYIDIGKTVNIGVIAAKNLVHGLSNLSGGHMLVERHPNQLPDFKSTCIHHRNCLQGFITLNSISCRYGIDILRMHTIRDDHPIWKLIGFYIAQLCINLTYLLSPEVIVINGDIMNRREIFTCIQDEFRKLLNGYISNQKLSKNSINTYIGRPKIASSGVKGSMLLKTLNQHIG